MKLQTTVLVNSRKLHEPANKIQTQRKKKKAMASTVDILNQIIKDGTNRGLIHHHTEDENLDGQEITIKGKSLVNFGSCSYLGLETHPALKEGVIDAVTKYGTQFSSSRTYLSLGLYHELETALDTIFEKPTIVTATTTLGHLATLPVIIGENDAVVLDLQVHSSIQMATQLLKARKVPVYVIRHNCMESLEKKIQHLNNKHDKIWYFADGVYSMYGDFAPFQELEALMDKYKKFHLYIDDAHGMSWTGKNGVGVVRSHMKHHDKMVLAVSLNKSFGAAGGCIVFPNAEMEEKVRNCGSTYIFCGPIQPPMLGAACASMKFHLSTELEDRQAELRELIDYTNMRLNELSLPQFMQTDSPLFFIPAGLPTITYDIIGKMKEDGFYLNSAAFPAVPMKKSGIRFMINNNLSKQNINAMLEALQINYLNALTDANSNCQYVSKVFAIPDFDIKVKGSQDHEEDDFGIDLQVELVPSIHAVNKEEWNALFINNGNLNYSNLELVEQTFQGNTAPENNWDFQYITIKDAQDNIVLKTFFTTALVKDDMFSPATVSAKVEIMRQEDPYALSSKNVMTGSMITKGEHVYINRAHKNWKKALALLVKAMQNTMDEAGATKLMLRDFVGDKDQELEQVFLELGLINYELLDNCVINELNWNDRTEFLAQLGQKYRYNVRKEILKFEDRFIVKTHKPQTEDEINACYELYSAVYDKALELNVFKLPKSYFKAMCADDNYDVIQLYLQPEFVEGATEPILVGVLFSELNATTYNAMLVGLDYKYVTAHNTYKQILFQSLERAKALDCKSLDLAYTAELTKKKLGAKLQKVRAFVQSTEHFNHQILDAILQ